MWFATKTRTSRRCIDLDHVTEQLLNEWKRSQQRQGRHHRETIRRAHRAVIGAQRLGLVVETRQLDALRRLR